jgi:radical SAM protein with 4Fe4S-binding SPASM domain
MGTHSQVGCHRVGPGNGFFAEHGYLEVPSLVQWMATLRCGLSCAHCLAVSRESGFPDMPLEQVRGLIDEIAGMGVREFLVTGGEPLAREDLGEVIEHLGRSGMGWTLNTATLPGPELRGAIERNRPGFVAVSLDGPREVHDAFRGRTGAWDEAMEAIRFFKSLEGVRVCAGTTVTSRNYDFLDETFHLVTSGGADQWGIHLLVPEGRAADRPDLFLSKAQLKRLIKFVARKRQHFYVEMADEIGYLGYLEPLVREFPLHCGAGRAQCVVLPDGEVVPCTTLDCSSSAGNLHHRPFKEIWTDGFADLRSWRPSGKCGRCEYAVACKGGCWLQRKAGAECFKEVWHVPGALKTAAGIAICLGGLAAPGEAGAVTSTSNAMQSAVLLKQAGVLHAVAAEQAWSLDEVINSWYFNQAAAMFLQSRTPPASDPIWNEVAWKFFRDFKEDALPQDIIERCARVSMVLETQERSLSLISLLWRAVSGPLFEASSPTPFSPPIRDGSARRVYSETERSAINATLAAIGEKAQEWRLEIFERNLDPYLSNGRTTSPSPYPLPIAKSGGGGGIGYQFDTRYYLSRDLDEERWGAGTDPDSREAAEAYVQAHRYAQQMELFFTCWVSPIRRDPVMGDVLNVDIPELSSGPNQMGLFDVIATNGVTQIRFEIKGNIKHSPAPAPFLRDETSLLDDSPGEQDISTSVSIQLPGGAQYTYTELLNAVYEQHRPKLLAIAYDWLSANMIGMWDQNVRVVTAVHENGALLWPAIREIIESNSLIPVPGKSGNAMKQFSPSETAEIHRRAVLKDIDFWMF